MYSISFIGAGNMAFRLSIALLEAGHTIDYIYDRTPKNGQRLVKALSDNGSSTRYTDSLQDILSSEVIIIAVSDDAIPIIVDQLVNTLAYTDKNSTPTILHTSGATELSALGLLHLNMCEIGVFYPLMTLSKGKNIDFSEVPFLLEADMPGAQKILTDLAVSLKAEYIFCNSYKRLRMHCAAVFSCNFVNYILSLAYEVAGDKATFLIPSTIEGVRKAFMVNPDKMQTGPALRGDVKTMEKHIKLLQSLNLSEEAEIYKIISNNIPNRIKKEK